MHERIDSGQPPYDSRNRSARWRINSEVTNPLHPETTYFGRLSGSVGFRTKLLGAVAGIGLGVGNGCKDDVNAKGETICLYDGDCDRVCGQCVEGVCVSDCVPETSSASTTGDPTPTTDDPTATDTPTTDTPTTATTEDPDTSASDPTTETGSTGSTSACDDAALDALGLSLEEILGIAIAKDVCDHAQPLPAGNETVHSDGVEITTAQEECDWIAGGSVIVDLPGDVPCGAGDGYTVLCTGETLALGGPAVVVFGRLAAPVDIAEGEFSYQYGFVFDVDGDPDNNYEPGPAYPSDFFADSDLWLYTVHPAGEDWYTWASSAAEGFTNVPSSERIIVIDDFVVLVIDGDEVDATTASWRMTAFRHLGDYGASLPWSGDVVPPVGEPLTPLQ